MGTGHNLRGDAERAPRLAHPLQRGRRAAATGGRPAAGPRQRPPAARNAWAGRRLVTSDGRVMTDELPSEKDTIQKTKKGKTDENAKKINDDYDDARVVSFY